MKAELILDAKATVGEGPVWDHRKALLYWVDIMQGHLHVYDPHADKDTVHEFGQFVGAAVPRAEEGLVMALQHGFAFYHDATQSLEMIHDPEGDLPGNRFNDGKCDPAGRFWAGTMEIEEKQNPLGNLYCLNHDLSVEKKLSNLYISNGLAWSSDHTKMYFIDTLTYKVQCFAYELTTGEIQYERDVVKIDPEQMGAPDGMTIDAEDNLWVAMYDGGKICCFDPVAGKLLEQIEVPAKKSSSCAFGGEDLDTLYITSIARDTDVQTDPYAGGLFAVKPGVKGVRADFFKG